MKLLDLSKFGKIAEDKHTATMKHSDGHTMTIMLAALPKIQREQLKRLKMADGGGVQGASDDSQGSPPPSSDAADNDPHKGMTINVNTAPAAPQESPAPPAAPAQPQAAQAPGTLPGSPNMTNPGTAAQLPSQSLTLATKAADEQQAVDQAKAQGTVPIAQQQQYNAQSVQDRQNQTIADMQAHTQAFADYMTQHPINPMAYQQNLGTGAKVANAIGLILGGFSGGHSGTGVNPAYNFMMAQQDKDIQAQKDRMDQAKTIFGAYHQLYGDENTSTALTKASMNDKLIADTNVMNAKLGTPQAQANRDALVAKLQDEKYKQLQQAALFSTGYGGSGPRNGMHKNTAPAPGSTGYNDGDLKPGSPDAPMTDKPPQVNVDYDKINRSTYLGSQGSPNQILPNEVGAVNDAADKINTTNQAIRAIHDAYAQMWKNSGPNDFNDIVKMTKDQNVFGVHVPDVSNWSAGAKRYFTAASTVKKQLANVVAGGGSSELYSLIEDQLPRGNDTPTDYREKLANVDKILMQRLPVAVMKKYGLAQGLPE